MCCAFASCALGEYKSVETMEQSRSSSPELHRRAAVVEWLHAGHTPADIVNLLGYPKSTVYNIARRHGAAEETEEPSGIVPRQTHTREEAARTPNVIERAFSEDPGR